MSSHLPYIKKQLFVPCLDELKKVLTKGLKNNFECVNISVIDCPNLSEEPFTLAATGLCGNAKILDVGGPPYLLPLPQKNKIYEFKQIAKVVDMEECFIIGAGAGPWPYVGVNCEGIYNLYIKNNDIKNESRVSKVDEKNGQCIQDILPNTEAKFCLLGNLLVSEGKQAKVLKVNCKKRIGIDNFISSMRTTLAEHYGDKIVGMGGTFLIKKGKARQHVMPDFSKTPIHTDEEVDKWLKFYEMTAPLIAVGTFVSGDFDLDLRVQHFHSFSHHGEAGHYHYDVTPDIVEYEGYFTVANEIYRIDKPEKTHDVGRD